MQTITIDGRTSGPGRKAFLIAEIAQAHAYIAAAAQAGADAVKFQIHMADLEKLIGRKLSRVVTARNSKFTMPQCFANDSLLSP